MQVPATSYPYPSSSAQGYPNQWGPSSPAQNQSYFGLPAPANLQANPAALMPLQQAYREALQEIMNAPEKRREFLSVVQDMQTGKLTPELLSKRMSRLLERSKAESFEKPSPMSVLTAVVLATGGGLLVGQGVKNLFTQLEQSKNSSLERIFRGFDRIPVLSYFSQGFETYLEKASKLAGIHPHPLLSLDGSYYTPAELRRFTVQRQFGKGGFQQAALDSIRVQLQPYVLTKKANAVVNGLQKADRYSALLQVMKPELEHFLPDSFREMIPHLGDYKHLKLWQVDQHSAKSYFLRLLGEAAYEQDVNPKVARQLFDDIKASKLTFADFVEKKALTKEPYRQIIQTLFKKKPVKSYQELRTAMNLRPFWTYLNEATEGLLWRGRSQMPLEAFPSSTLHDLEKRIIRLHIAGQLKLIPAWQAFEKKMRGPLMRIHGLETMSMPILESEYTLMKVLRHRGIGPFGRLMGKLGFNLNQMFNAGNFQRWTLQQAGMSKPLSMNMGSGLGRVVLAAMVFGLAAQTGMNAPKESRKAKLADQLALGVGGYYGLTLAMSLMPRTAIPRSLSILNSIGTTKIPLLPFTWGGFIDFWVIGAIFGNYASKLLQWPIHKLFGHPPREGDDAKPSHAPTQSLGGMPKLDSSEKQQLASLMRSSPVQSASSLMPIQQAYSPYSQTPAQNSYQAYTYPQSSPLPQSMPPQVSYPAASPLASNPNLAQTHLSAEEALSSPATAVASKQAKVLYSTQGLGSISQVSRNRHQEKQGNDEQKLLKELRRMQKDLY